MTRIPRNHRQMRTRMSFLIALVSLSADVTSSAPALVSLLGICNPNEINFETDFKVKLHCCNLAKTEEVRNITAEYELSSICCGKVGSCKHVPNTFRLKKNVMIISPGTVQPCLEIEDYNISQFRKPIIQFFEILQPKVKFTVPKETEIRGNRSAFGLLRYNFAVVTFTITHGCTECCISRICILELQKLFTNDLEDSLFTMKFTKYICCVNSCRDNALLCAWKQQWMVLETVRVMEFIKLIPFSFFVAYKFDQFSYHFLWSSSSVRRIGTLSVTGRPNPFLQKNRKLIHTIHKSRVQRNIRLESNKYKIHEELLTLDCVLLSATRITFKYTNPNVSHWNLISMDLLHMTEEYRKHFMNKPGNVFSLNIQTNMLLCELRRHMLSHCQISNHSADMVFETYFVIFFERAIIAFNWWQHVCNKESLSVLFYRPKSKCLSKLSKEICEAINSRCLNCSYIFRLTVTNVKHGEVLFKFSVSVYACRLLFLCNNRHATKQFWLICKYVIGQEFVTDCCVHDHHSQSLSFSRFSLKTNGTDLNNNDKFHKLFFYFTFEKIDEFQNSSHFICLSRLVNQSFILFVDNFKSIISKIASMSVGNSPKIFFVNIFELRNLFGAMLCLLLMSFKTGFLQDDVVHLQFLEECFEMLSVVVSWIRREHWNYKEYTFNLFTIYYNNGFNNKSSPSENVKLRCQKGYNPCSYDKRTYDSSVKYVASLLGESTCYGYEDKRFAFYNKGFVRDCYRSSYLLSLGDTHEKVHMNLYPVYKSTLDRHFESSLDNPSTDSSFEFELIRVGTFSSFSGSNAPSSLTLARAGFFFTGEADTMECFHCHVRHSNWNAKDNPFDVHRRISPSCGFINGQVSLNVPVARHSGNAYLYATTESDSTVKNGGLGETRLPCRNNNSSSTDQQQHNNPIQFENHFQLKSDDARLQNRFNSSSQHIQNGSTHPELENATRLNAPMSNARASHEAITNNKLTENNRQQNVEHHQQRTDTGLINKTSRPFSQRSKPHTLKQNSQVNRPLDIAPERPVNGMSTSGYESLKLEPLGVVSVSPRYPAYAVLSVRMSTYQGWPPTSGQSPQQMATAGFIFAGYSDYTRCFFCGGGLRNWEPGDDPWIEHAKWFPKCVYLRQNKGDSFVLLVHQTLINPNILEASHINETSSEHTTEENILPALVPTSKSTTAPSNITAIQSVQEMGYSQQIIDSAIMTLRNDGKEVDAYNIMDVILTNDRENSSTSSTSPCHFASQEAEPVCQTDKAELQASGHNIDSTSSQLQEMNLSDIKSLVEENKSLKESRLCKVCLENDASIAFVPCGHLVCCGECAFALRKCPICRKFVEGRVKTWMA